MAKTVTRQKEN